MSDFDTLPADAGYDHDTTDERNPVAPNHLGLIIDENTTYEGWVDLGAQIAMKDRQLSWMIGDWWAFGSKRKYGERIGAAIEAGVPPERLSKYAVVAKKFELFRRRNDVPFSIYAELAAIEDDEERYFLLDQAIAEEWTKAQTRDAVKALKGPAEKGPAEPKHTDRGLLVQSRKLMSAASGEQLAAMERELHQRCIDTGVIKDEPAAIAEPITYVPSRDAPKVEPVAEPTAPEDDWKDQPDEAFWHHLNATMTHTERFLSEAHGAVTRLMQDEAKRQRVIKFRDQLNGLVVNLSDRPALIERFGELLGVVSWPEGLDELASMVTARRAELAQPEPQKKSRRRAAAEKTADDTLYTAPEPEVGQPEASSPPAVEVSARAEPLPTTGDAPKDAAALAAALVAAKLPKVKLSDERIAAIQAQWAASDQSEATLRAMRLEHKFQYPTQLQVLLGIPLEAPTSSLGAGK